MWRKQHFVNVYHETHQIIKAQAALNNKSMKDTFKEILDETGIIQYEPYKYTLNKPTMRKNILIQTSKEDRIRLKEAANKAGTSMLIYTWYLVEYWVSNHKRLETTEHN